jgi:hypothetical protein
VAPILFFRPDKDLAMQYASNWLGYGVTEAKNRGYDVIDMADEEATKEKFMKVMETEKPELCFLGGHGSPTVFTGYEQQIVMEACQNDQIMTATISHLLSCYVGQQLLPSMISKGAISTIGYNVDFQFYIDTNYSVDTDPYAQPFKELTLTIIEKMLDGVKLKDVWNAGIAKCDELIARYWDKPEIDWSNVISALQHDRDGMIALGDKESYIMPPRKVKLASPQTLGLGVIIGAFLLTR